VELLLNYGANISLQDFNGDSPLHIASRFGHADIVPLLIKFGADFVLLNNEHKTAEDLSKSNLVTESFKMMYREAKKILPLNYSIKEKIAIIEKMNEKLEQQNIALQESLNNPLSPKDIIEKIESMYHITS